MKRINQITFWVFLSFWPVWLLWEIALLIMRGQGWAEIPDTISMVARDRGWHVSSVVYLLGGLATHFWWNSRKWASVAGSIIFWVVVLGLLGQDIYLWNSAYETWPIWLRIERWPLMWLGLGSLAGRFLFPQRGVMPWD